MSVEGSQFDFRSWWLNAEDVAEPSAASRYMNIGVTPELYTAWSETLRRPIYTWLELRWTATTHDVAEASGLRERIRAQFESAKSAFCLFLKEHPELPTTAIRPLLEDVLGKYYVDNRNMHANPIAYRENRVEDIDKFVDSALIFYRDKAVEWGPGVRE